MRASLLILLLCGLHAAKATLNYHHFSKPFEILTDNAAKNLKDFVDSMHFENVQKLIWPKVQNNVDYVKKLLEPSTIVKLALEQDRKTVNYELDKLQKLGDLKKQQFEEYFKKKALKLIVPPPPPPRPPTKTRHNHYHEEYVKEIGPSELFRIPPSMDQQKYEIYFEEIAPNKFIKVIKPWPYGKLNTVENTLKYGYLKIDCNSEKYSETVVAPIKTFDKGTEISNISKFHQSSLKPHFPNFRFEVLSV